MLVYGSKSKIVTGSLTTELQCRDCGGEHFLTFGLIKYFHIYWVPAFITSKKIGAECTHCKKPLLGSELPEQLVKGIKTSVFKKKNTLPLFSGLLIILCLAAFLSYAVYEDIKQEAAYFEHPAVNDFYTVDFKIMYPDSDPKYHYGLMRIKSITESEVEFQVSQLAYDKAKGVSKDISSGKANSDAYYDKETVVLPLEQLKVIKNSGAIYDIDRR
jgi:hypothetical protein